LIAAERHARRVRRKSNHAAEATNTRKTFFAGN